MAFTLFKAAQKGASIPMTSGFAFGGRNPYSSQLPAGGNGITPRQPIVGAFGIPSSYGTWQQPVTAPPTPQPGPKGILKDQPIVPATGRTVPLFSPATNYDPNNPL